MDTKELLLRMIVMKGYIVAKESYYGDDNNYPKTHEARDNLDKYIESIDFKKTDSPCDDTEMKFAGTFSEPDYNIIVRCEIKRKGFKGKVLWKMDTDNVDGLCGMVNYCAELFESIKK
jgi:hypothetical protein